MKLFRPLLGGALLGAVIAAAAPVVGIVPFSIGPAVAHHSSTPATTHHVTSASTTPPAPSSTTPPPPPEVNDPAIAAEVQQAVRASVPDAQVGVEVVDRQTGTVLTNLNETHQFPTMSVVKLLIALDVLHNNGWELPSSDTQQELTRMLSYSDDAIASNLWGSYGGPAIVTQMANVIGLSGTEPPSGDPGEWGDTLTTPADMVKLYSYITDKLPAPDRDLIVNALYNTVQIAADGTDQYFGIPDGLPHSTWAIKQGWGTSGNRAVINTTGLIGSDDRYVVVVLTYASAGTDSALISAITPGTRKLAGLVS